jgi:hypothetical protein
MHAYRKVLFPGLREKRFVWGHRRVGHKVVHFGTLPGNLAVRCYWCCDCGARHWC